MPKRTPHADPAPFVNAIAALEPAAILDGMDRDGFTVTAPLINADACAELARLYTANKAAFRTTVAMARHGCGSGEYKYFARPVPNFVASLRRALYERLAPVANSWDARLGRAADWPADHESLVARCTAAGQTRPTPLLLRYGPGDYRAFAVIPVKERPVPSLRGTVRIQVRHGVSRVHRGLRRTLGLIFHDAA
jgi:uncharacterized protein